MLKYLIPLTMRKYNDANATLLTTYPERLGFPSLPKKRRHKLKYIFLTTGS